MTRRAAAELFILTLAQRAAAKKEVFDRRMAALVAIMSDAEQSADRTAAINALDLIELVVASSGLDGAHKDVLLETLLRFKEAFQGLDLGCTSPMVTPRLVIGRPGTDPKREEFRIRCVIAVTYLVATGLSRKDSARKVASIGAKSAERLGVNRPTGGTRGFNFVTVENWHKRHNTKWKKWRGSGSPDDQQDREIILRDFAESDKKVWGQEADTSWMLSLRGPCGPDAKPWPTLTELSDLWLRGVECIDRPMRIVSGRGLA